MAQGNDTFTFIQQDRMARSFDEFCRMRNAEELCDVSIRTKKCVLKAHKIILGAAIPYFHTMFTSTFRERDEKECPMDKVDPDALESLIDFAYTSKVEITAKNVQSLFETSQYLLVPEIEDGCRDFMSKNLDQKNIVEVRKFAEIQHCSGLVASCDSYIAENFDSFCESKDFLKLPFSALTKLIRRDDLHVTNEKKVFEAVLTWVKKDTERRTDLPELLTGIRMTFLSPLFLDKKASTENLIRENTLCMNLLHEAKENYNLQREDGRSNSFSLSQRCYTGQDKIYLFCCNDNTGLTVLEYSPKKLNLIERLTDSECKDLKHVVALDDKMYIFRNKHFELFIPPTSCTSLPNFFSNKVPFEYAVPLKGKIYWLADCCFEERIDVFDCALNKWSNLNKHVKFEHGAKVVSTKTKIYILGKGKHGKVSYNKCRTYDPQTDTVKEINCQKSVCSSFGCASLNENVYVCGGKRVLSKAQSHEDVIKAGEVYNPNLGTWDAISPMKTERQNFSLVSCNKKLFAFGGTMSNGMFNNNIECYDPKTDKWTMAGEISGNYSFIQAVATSEH